MPRRNIGSAIVLVLMAVLVMACGDDEGSQGESGSAATAETQAVKIGIARGNFPYAPIAVGIDQGFYEDEGLDVEEVEFQSGGDITSALISGDIDVGVTGVDRPVLLLAENQPPLKAIMGLKMTPAFIMLAQNDLDVPEGDVVATMQALRDKRIGIAGLGGNADANLTALLAAADMTKDDVVVVEVGLGPTALAAMKQKTVDANFVIEPDLSIIQSQNLGKVVLDMRNPEHVGESLSQVPNTTALASPDWLEENTETAKKLIRATNKAIEFIRSNREEAVAITAETFGVEPDIVDSLYDSEMTKFTTQFSEEGYTSLVDALVAAEAITEDQRPAYTEAVATELAGDWMP